MTIEVIGGGFGRTGTTSLKAALEQLQFNKCYHLSEMLVRPWHAPLWERAFRGHAIDWNKIFRDYRATVDWPSCTFYRQLMQRYPQAKVILTVRDPDEWYDSAYETIYEFSRIRMVRPPLSRILGLVAPHMTHTVIWQGTFHGQFANRAYAIEIFKRHNDDVVRTVPADRLLVFDVRQGWEPLCHFLDQPVPNEPFPRLNDKQFFKRLIMLQRVTWWLFLFGVTRGTWRIQRALRNH